MISKPECFVIMPIKNPYTEFLWNDVYVPVCDATGMDARRVDKNDDGTPLYTQITQYLNASSLVIADLTMARPNCYFEVGFAMGKERHNSLILTCREDHNSDSPRYKPGTAKVHFDLQSFGITWWRPKALTLFKEELIEVIERRGKLNSLPVPKATTAERRIQSPKTSRMEARAVESVVKKGEEALKKWKKKI